MSTLSLRVIDCINRIHNNTLYLPAIQRKLVWDKERIENYIDSLLRGYPIGTFIWWKLDSKIMNNYPFYKFLNNFHERDAKTNEIMQRNIFKPSSFGVLDGQQRLNSIYIGLTGSYTYRRKGKARKELDRNYVDSKLYINLFENKEHQAQSYNKYEIKFLSEKEASNIDINHFWFELGNVITWDKRNSAKDYYFQLINNYKRTNSKIKLPHKIELKYINNKNEIINKLETVRNRIINDKVLNYFIVKENNIEKVVEIFQRVNSGGLELTKSDLLFSRLVSEWPSGRKKLEEAISSLKLLNIWVDIEFIMRICLTLCDLPVLYKEKTFSDHNVEQIRQNWPKIVESLIKTAHLIQKFGFTKGNLKSKNSLIPIAYYIFKGGNIKYSDVKKYLKKYIIVSHVKKIFSGQGDNVLNKIRDCLRKEVKGEKRKTYILRNTKFNYSQLYKINFTGSKTFKINKEFIEEKLLDKKYGHETFMLLTLLYPNIDYQKNLFEMDHIHPKAKFTDKELSKIRLTKYGIKKWQKMKDGLPNLQLLVGEINQEKLHSFLNSWLKKIEKDNKGSKREFIKDNFLPLRTSYRLNNFEKFYEKRRKIIYLKLKSILL